MSLETTLERIATALETIAKSGGITAAPAAPEPKPAKKEKPAAAPAPAAPFPVDKPAAAPAPTPAATPFTDLTGLKQYVKTTYDELGPEKGNQMIEVLKEIGVASINDIGADKYGVFFEKVEALKAS